MANVKIIVETVDRGSTKSLKNVNDQLDIAQKSLVAIGAAAITFKQAFDLSREGAQTIQLAESFELMNKQVFKTPDLLDQMRKSSQGVISDHELMSGLLTLSAGATDEVAQAMAQASPRLLEIAKASNKLNPTLGDTAFLYDSISKGIKRQSPLILDNLGIVIKAEQAMNNYAESIGKSADELDANERTMAFLNETMRAGDQLISQVGGNVSSQTDSWDRLTVRVNDNKIALQQWLAQGLNPILDIAAGSNEQQAQEIIDSIDLTAKSMAELQDRMGGLVQARKEFAGLGVSLTGTDDISRKAIVDTARAIAMQSDSVEELEQALEDATGGEFFRDMKTGDAVIRGTIISWDQLTNVVGLANMEMTEAQKAGEVQRREWAEQQAELDRLAASQEEVVEEMSDAEKQYRFNAAVAKDLANSNEEVVITHEDLREAEERRIETAKRLAEAQKEIFTTMQEGVRGAKGPIEELIEAQTLLEESSGEWVETTRTHAGEIGEIQEQLALDLNDEQKQMWQDVLDTTDEGSQEWLQAYSSLQEDLTSKQRMELVARLADLQANSGETISVYTGDAEAAEEAQERIAEAYAAISESYRQTALTIFESKIATLIEEDGAAAALAMVQYQEALGLITPEESAMLQEVAVKTEEIKSATEEMLATYLEDGVLTQEEMAKMAEKVNEIETATFDAETAVVQFGETAPGMIEGVGESVDGTKDDFINATTEVIKYKEQLLQIPQEVRTKVVTEFQEVGSPPSGLGDGPAPFALGGEVTGGTPGLDSVLAMLTPGERVLSVAENQAMKRGDLGEESGRPVEINIYVSGAGNPRMVAEKTAAVVSESLGSL